MKIALTVWGNRISPVFDSAHILLIAKIKNTKVTNRRYEQFNPEIPLHLIKMIRQMDISVLICGAISELPANIIEATGIKLVPFIAGDVEKILERYSKCKPIIPQYLMPGCRKRYNRQCGKNIYFAQQKEVNNMPKRDGTGPQGQGPKSGKGKGGCKTGKSGNSGQGKGRGDGKGKGQNNQGSGKQ